MQSVYGVPATVERWQINRCKVSYCTFHASVSKNKALLILVHTNTIKYRSAKSDAIHYLEVVRLVYRIIRCARPRIELIVRLCNPPTLRSKVGEGAQYVKNSNT